MIIPFRWLIPAFLLAATVFQGLAAQEGAIAITGVSVVDIQNGQIRPDQTIVVIADQIVAVTPAVDAGIPDSATIVDGTGKFAIPGLWDMHIHWYHLESMALFSVNGVTGVRLMWGSPLHHAWRTAIEENRSVGPRMLIASAIIDGPDPIWPGSIVAANAEEGIAAVEKAIAAKSDFAKVYSLLPRDAYFSIAEEANRRGLDFAGHVPVMVSVGEASEAGQKSMEHMYEVILSCSAREDEMRALQRETIGSKGGVRALMGNRDVRDRIAQTALDSFDPEKAKRLFKTLRENETWICPTLTVLRNITYLDEPSVRDNPNLQYIPKFLARSIAPPERETPPGEADRQRAEATLAKNRQLLLEMHRAGVPVLAGTDCLNPFCLPGFSLHTELELLVETGFTPSEALKTATINPARFQGKEDSMGTLEPGKVADIVLLDKNPLEDIRHTRTIFAVVNHGNVLERSQLDEILAGLKQE